MGTGDNRVGNLSFMNDESDKVGKWWLAKHSRSETVFWTTEGSGDESAAGFGYAFMAVEFDVILWYFWEEHKRCSLLRWREFEHRTSKCGGYGMAFELDKRRLTWFLSQQCISKETTQFGKRLDHGGWWKKRPDGKKKENFALKLLCLALERSSMS